MTMRDRHRFRYDCSIRKGSGIMPFSDPEEKRRYQRELMRKRRAESKRKEGSNKPERTNTRTNNVRPENGKAERCPYDCGYKTRDHDKLLRHAAKYCTANPQSEASRKKTAQGSNTFHRDHMPAVSPVSFGKFLRIKSIIAGDELQAHCPSCGYLNAVDMNRSFRPVRKCDHFQQLVVPGKWSDFLFKAKKGLTVMRRGPAEGLTRSNTSTEEGQSVSPTEGRYFLVSLAVDEYQTVLKVWDKDHWKYVGRFLGPDRPKVGELFSGNDILVFGKHYARSENQHKNVKPVVP